MVFTERMSGTGLRDWMAGNERIEWEWAGDVFWGCKILRSYC